MAAQAARGAGLRRVLSRNAPAARQRGIPSFSRVWSSSRPLSVSFWSFWNALRAASSSAHDPVDRPRVHAFGLKGLLDGLDLLGAGAAVHARCGVLAGGLVTIWPTRILLSKAHASMELGRAPPESKCRGRDSAAEGPRRGPGPQAESALPPAPRTGQFPGAGRWRRRRPRDLEDVPLVEGLPRQQGRTGTCPFRLTRPGVRRTGCGRSSAALGLGSEGPRVDLRVPCGASDARRRKTEANRADRPIGDSRVAGPPQPAGWILRRLARVAMMEAADHGGLDDPALVEALHRSRLRGVLLQREVGPGTVVVGKVSRAAGDAGGPRWS